MSAQTMSAIANPERRPMFPRPEALARPGNGCNEEVLALHPGSQSDAHHDGGITYTRTRVLAPPSALLQENRIVGSNGHDAVADAYKILCIQVLQRLRERDGNALAIVSAGQSEGKSLTAINLAVSLAREVDQTVLLVDADLRKPSIHDFFGFRPDAGLSDHLISGVPLDCILVNPAIERFVILPGGRPLPNSAEMLGSVKMQKLVAELKERYPSRVVIFDLPPVLSVADALAFAPYVDAALLVVQENRTCREDILRALEMLGSVDVIGTVLNQSLAVPKPYETERRPRLLRRLLGRR
jgi:protein-tyrosine kinase